ncbi:ATP-binding protein [Streptomyces sp. NPDC086549]|uniref:ATP-binding protein n=1 Tax=Streptomyces sp. NPDC086549 TaxID=3365752 RepID=UPI00382C0C51
MCTRLEIEVRTPTVAAAMLDRLLHRAAVVGIDGPSYRLRSHQSHADNLRKGVTGRAG